MATRFLLHGGRTRLSDSRNDSFFRAVTDDLSDGDQVLHIGFARTNLDDRRAVYERDRTLLLNQTDKNIRVVNATYEDLIEQIMLARSVYIAGGDAVALFNDIRRYEDFLPTLRGKTIAGTSSGAALFSTHYFSDEHGICDGLATLPIRLMVHFGNSRFAGTKESLKLLENLDNRLELVVLKECEWVVREAEL